MKQRLFVLFVYSLLAFQSYATDLYWVNGSGNWSDTLSHWSTTSGGPAGATLPQAGDNVIFDANSGLISLATSVTVDTIILADTVDFSGLGNMFTMDAIVNYDHIIFGSIIGNTSGIDFTGAWGEIQLDAVSPGETILSGSIVWEHDFRVIGESISLLDDFNLNQNDLYIDSTGFISNGYNITLGSFYSTTQAVRNLDFNNSTINVNDGVWDVDGTNVTADLIGVINLENTLGIATFIGGGLNYGEVYSNSATTTDYYDNNTFFLFECPVSETLRINNGDDLSTDSLRLFGDCTNKFIIETINAGASGTITKTGYNTFQGSGLSVNNVDALGGANYDISLSDLTNTTGWEIAPANFYWIDDSGDWNDPNQWSLSSGGPAAGCIPDSNDWVFFDVNSFTAPSQQVLVDDTAYFAYMDWTGITDPQILALDSSIYVHGDMVLNTNLTVNKNLPSSSFRVKSNTQLTTNNATINCDFAIVMNDNTNSFDLLDDYINSSATNLLLFNGGLNTQGNRVETGNIVSINNPATGTDQREINFGSSEIRLFGEFNALGDTVLNLLPGTSDLFIGDPSLNNGLITEGNNFYNVTLDFPNNSNAQRVEGENTFNKLTILAGSYVFLKEDDTLVINDSLIMKGNCRDSIFLSTLDTASLTPASINKTGADILLECLNVKGVTNIGDQLTTYFSTDINGNTNWDFDATPPISTTFEPDSLLSSFCFGQQVYFDNTSTPLNGTISDLDFEWTVGDGSLPIEETTSTVEASLTGAQINYTQTPGTSSDALSPLTGWVEIADPQAIYDPSTSELNTTAGNANMNYTFTVGYRISLINGTGSDAYLVDMNADPGTVSYDYLPELKIFKNGSQFGVGSSQFAFPTHTFEEGTLSNGVTQIGTDTVSFNLVGQNLTITDILTTQIGADVSYVGFTNQPRWKDGSLTTDNDVTVSYRIDIDTIYMEAVPTTPVYEIEDLVHEFETGGDSIIVSLNSIDTRNYCEVADTFYIDIINPQLSLLASITDTTVCPNTEIEFEVYSNEPSTTFEFFYNNVSQNSPSVNDTIFSVNSILEDDTISAVAYENGCQSDTTPFYAYNVYAAPSFSWSNSSSAETICQNDTVLFTSTSPDSLNNFQFLVNNSSVSGIQDSIATYNTSSLIDDDVVSLVIIDTNSCTDTTSLTFTVNPLPTTSLVESSGGNVICENEMVTFTGSGAATYEFYLNDTLVQGPLATTTWSTDSLTQNDTVTVIGFTALGCQLKAPESYTYIVNPAPVNSLVSSDADNIICSDEAINFTSSGSSTYEFFVNGVSVQGPSTNNTYEPVSLADDDAVSVIGSAGGCQGNEPEIVITVNAAPTTTLVNDDGDNSICSGETVTFTASGANNYEFFVDGISQGAPSTNNEFVTSTLTNGQIVSVLGEINSCNLSASNTFTVLSAPNVSLISNDVDNIICDGESITFTGSNAAQYEFFVNTASVQGPVNNALLIDPTFNIGSNDVYLVGTANNGCTDTTGTIGVTVNAIPTITVSSSDADNTICEGENVTFTSTGGDTYQFLIDGTPQTSMSASNTFATTSLTNGQTLTVDASLAGCSSTSNSIVTTVNPSPSISLTSTDANNIFCEDELVTYTANGATEYEFFVDGVSQGPSSSTNTINSSSFTIGSYPIEVIGEASNCSNSTSILVTVNPLPSINLVSSDADNSICEGEAVNYTASGGSLYEFFVNGVSQGAPSTSTGFSISTLLDTDVVSVEGVSSLGCSNDDFFAPIEVLPIPNVNLTSNDPDQEICVGDNVVFTASGATQYEFFVNGVSQGAASTTSTLSLNNLANGDNITVEGTQNGCLDISNILNFNVFNYPVVSLVNNATDTVLCDDEFTNLEANGADNYLLYINGAPIGIASPSPIFNSLLNNGDEVTIQGETNGCESFSNAISYTVYNYPTITALASDPDLEICLNDTIEFTSNGAMSYELDINSLILDDNTSGDFSITNINDGDVVSITGFNGHCASAPASFAFTVNEMNLDLDLTPSNLICEGDNVTFTASGGDEYEFFLNNISTGPLSTNNTYSSSTLNHHDEVRVDAFNQTTGCLQSFNDFVIMNVMDTPTITPLSSIEFCEGDSVTLVSNIPYGNQWYLNGNPIADAVDTFVVADTSGNYTLEATMGGDGDLWSLGQNASGVFANGLNFNSAVPLSASTALKFAEISSGFDFVLGIDENNDLYAWGLNNSGQLGNGTYTSSNTPISSGGLTDIKTIATSATSSMATTFTGEVYVWGNNNEGQLGTGNTSVINFPFLNASLTDVDTIAGGREHFVLLKNDGTVFTVGNNDFGQLGDGTLLGSNTAIQIAGLTDIVAIGAGQYSSYAIDVNGDLFVWGNNSNGQLGLGDFNNRLVPTVATLENIISVQGGANHTVFLNNNNEAYTSGGNAYGQLGLNNQTPTAIPKKVELQGVNMIAAGQYSTLFKRTDHSVFGSGSNTENQIAPVSDTTILLPTHIETLEGVSFVEASRVSSHFIYNVENTCVSIPVITDFLPAPAVTILVDNDTLTASQTGVSYQWFFNGNEINNATNQTIEATSSGNYSVEVTFDNGCSSTSELYYHSIAGLSVLNSGSYVIYPNPAKDNLNVEVFNVKERFSVVLMDNLGKIVYQNQYDSSNAFLKTNNLDNGVYYLKIITGSFEKVEKVVINH